MSGGNDNSKLQIVLAIISLIGVLGGALIANWKDLSSSTRASSSSTTGAATRVASVAGTSISTEPLPSQCTGASRSELSTALASVNIGFSIPEVCDYLKNQYSLYPQLAKASLDLLDNQRLKQTVYFDVIFSDYKDAGGTISEDAADGNVNRELLKAALLKAYRANNPTNALSFQQIVEPR